MPLTMLCSGKRLQEVAPLEITIRWTRTPYSMGYAVAAVGDEGELQAMLPDFNEDETCVHGTQYAARVMALTYAKKWIDQGLSVIYRSDLEN